MSDTLKKGWRTWRFDQMAYMVNDRIDDPSKANVEHYVGLEHLDSDSLTIRRWGSPSDVEATKLCFRKGDIIFGRRRVYQRKLAVAPFDGICSAHAMVLRPKTDVVLPEFLPFFMQSDLFMERAKQISVGSLSPTINWKTLAAEEFALPPLDAQRRIAEVLVSGDATCESLKQVAERLLVLRRTMQNDLLFNSARSVRTVLLSDIAMIDPSDQPLPSDAPFIPMECVDSWERSVSRFEIRGERGGIRASKGDVLMARITPCLENGKIAQVPNHVMRCGGSTEFIVFRAKESTDKSYLYWLISSDRIRNTAVAMMSGSTGRQRVAGKDLAGIKITSFKKDQQADFGQQIDLVEMHRKAILARVLSAQRLQRNLLNGLTGGSS